MKFKQKLRKRIVQFLLFIIVYLCAVGASFVGMKHLYPIFHKPMVSVVIPVYNRADLVMEAIESVLKQTFQDYELIVVDDGSTDATPSILEGYALEDNRIKVITLPQNKGVSTARNTAQDAAKGKYLVLLDSDDLLYPRALEKLVRAMEENPSYDVLNAAILYTNKRPDLVLDSEKYTLHEGDRFPICMFFANCYINSGVIIRRDFIVKNNIRYSNLYTVGEDYDYWIQCIFAGAKIGSLKDRLTVIRFGHKSLTKNETAHWNADPIAIKQNINVRFQSSIPAKMDYSEKERCQLISEFMKFNKTKKIIDQQPMVRYYNRKCNEKSEKALLKHAFWTGEVIFESENRLCRIKPDDCASYTKKGDMLLLHWEGWNSREKFIYNADEKAYILVR